jgi:hypothetical protein
VASVRFGYTLDSGAFIAAEKNSRVFWALWKRAIVEDATVTVPVGVVAQVWRKGSVQVARLLQGCEIEDMDIVRAKTIGLYLGTEGGNDVIDAAVATGALARGDKVITSDPGDIARLDPKRALTILKV